MLIRLIESYAPGEILLALAAGIGTYFGGIEFVIAFIAGVLVAGLARRIDTFGLNE